MSLPYKGLSVDEVTERRRAGLSNATSIKPSRSSAKIIASNIFTYFNFVFLVISLLLISAGSELRNFSFLLIITANSLIGIFQELRAKRVLDKLKLLNTPISRVIREGKLARVPVTELVQDDIIFLKAGDQISADARILSGEVSVNESLLTGEPDEIEKGQNQNLLSGSFIVRGECYAVLTKVGASSYAAELTRKAKAIKTGEESQIIISLNKFVTLAGIAIIPIGIIMVATRLAAGVSYPVAIEAMVAAIISMIPEGLFLLASATLVLSAMRLAKQQVLLHDMKSIETLARTDILCVDKTGTITSGQMKVADTIWLTASAQPELLAAAVKNLPADSSTMSALKTAYKLPKNSQFAQESCQIQAFSSKLKYSGVTFAKQGSFVLGAPELVLREQFSQFSSQINSYTRKGLRVLVFAKYAGKFKNQALNAKTTPLALIVLEDEIRPSAAQTFAYFAEQKVQVKVISGDASLTVAAIAARAGIPGANKHIDLSNQLSDAELARAAAEYDVFGRVTPEDKRRLVQALQQQGHTVAMTGDGVNDVLALKDADCSIALASGTEAAASVAQMVLLESDFSKMPSIVAEGRRVVNNLERSGSLFIVKNLFSFASALLVILFGIVYPMVPAQVSLVTFWAIGVPSFLLAQIPNHKLIRGDFMHNILKAAVPTTIAAVAMVAAANAIARATGVDHRVLGNITAIVWAGVGLAHLFIIARPYNKINFGICLFCLLGSIASILFAKAFFGLEQHMGLLEWGIIFGAILCTIPLILLNRQLLRIMLNYWSTRRKASHEI